MADETESVAIVPVEHREEPAGLAATPVKSTTGEVLKDIYQGHAAYVIPAVAQGLAPSSTLITDGSVITSSPLPIEDLVRNPDKGQHDHDAPNDDDVDSPSYGEHAIHQSSIPMLVAGKPPLMAAGILESSETAATGIDDATAIGT